MEKVFLDTNIWMRYFIRTDEEQYKDAYALIQKIEYANLQGYTSAIVLLEVYFVGTKVYKIPEEDVVLWFEVIQNIRNITIIEKTNFPKALDLHRKYNVKLADCLIASQIPPKTTLVSFDKEFRKIKNLTVAEPHEIVK